MHKHIIFLLAALSSALNIHGQFISEVLEYKPAPGQFINTSAWGLPASANSLVGGTDGALSLGAFGGYVIFKFEKPVQNDKNNPYGIDFVIYGNPLENLSTPELNNNVTWAEPGIVSVMKDKNGNGLPDDTWYELAGSDYFFSTTKKNYAVTYTNPGGDKATDVPWTDNQGETGYVYANSFHAQPYYPQTENFPDISTSAYTLIGTRIKDFVDRTNPSYITAAGRPWGYVDNNLRNSYNSLPDNPYTDNIEEGSGGDAFDISWAVDATGKYIDLDQIDFIKVHNAVLADAGWLGEVSTELTGAFDVAPDASITGWDSTSLVLNNIPVQVSLDHTYLLEAAFFINGRKVDADNFQWSAEPFGLVSIDENNLLITISAGTVTITADCTYKGTSYSNTMTTTIVASASVQISMDQTTIRVGEKYRVQAEVKDQNGNSISSLNLTWTTSNSNTGILEEDDNIFITGLETGTSKIYVSPNGYPEIKDSVEVTILEAVGTIDVYLALNTNEGTFYPKSKITVSNYDLTPYIKNPNHSYGIGDISNITAAHAIASVFENVSFESDLRFKDTETEGLYIYKLPVITGSVSTYYYGYGNYGNEDDNSCWMVCAGNTTYFRNMENITLYDGDEVTAYYVDDITKSWDVISFTGSSYAINAGEPIELSLIRKSYYLYSGTTVMQTKSEGIANEPIKVNGEPYMQNGLALTTNSEGNASLVIFEPGIYTVSAAGQILMLEVSQGTGMHTKQTKKTEVFPNPANAILTLSTSNLPEVTAIKITNISGQEIRTNYRVQKNGKYMFNTAAWPQGIYLIRVYTTQDIFTQKVTVAH